MTPMSRSRPEPARQLPVALVSGYVDRIGMRPGEQVGIHVNAPASYELSIVKLGTTAIADPGSDEAEDRADAQVMTRSRHDRATRQTISPGSYVFVGGDPVGDAPLTMGLWLRLWRLPVIDVVQWAWFGLITDLDYPEAARFGLLVDHMGRLALYAGDGGAFRHEWLHVSGPVLLDRLGQWVHVAATIAEAGVGLFLDGVHVNTDGGPIPRSPPGPRSRLRIGANAEHGQANDFLDGDIAAPFVSGRLLPDTVLAAVVADRARTRLDLLGLEPLLGAWPLTEEQGSHVADISGSGRDGQIVQGGTWQIGGPAHEASHGVPGYDPAADPERGHGLRLSSDDLADAEWSVTDTWVVPEDAAPGIYAARVVLDGQDEQEAVSIVFAVGRTRPARSGVVALLLSTNTWYAYGRRPTLEAPVAGLSASFYSNHLSGRPFFHVTTLAPIPRADPYGFESARAAFTRHSHLVRPERYAEAWLVSEGYAYEVITDTDLHAEPECLGRFQALMIAGHSEYWSNTQREAVDGYLRAGGRVVSLSGNTLCWRTSFNPELTILESRKAVRSDDHRWLPPSSWGERWHGDDGEAGGSFVLLDLPGWAVLGLDTQGMIDDGTPTAFSPLDIFSPEHPLFHHPEEVPIGEAGRIGERGLNGPRASGYEFDATPERVGLRSDPLPGLVVLASATGQRNIEWSGVERHHGCDVVYWERPQGGRVFNAASIGITGSLIVDPGLRTLLRNVMAHFGVSRQVGG